MSEIPQRIQELLESDEVEEIENREGWAFGTVALKNEDGEIEQELEGAVIELFNGEGGAGKFGGVRFMWVDEDVDYVEPWEEAGLVEAYAHGDDASLDKHGSLPSWFVKEWTDPENPRVGKASP